ncbi:MAG: hypothetical protein JRJ09_17555 [Deltaproteobacteria bacterium]|nr:hypothetical protein [Deltaproteobacteria bacterium]MBW2050313.1 hypothetical protein [Deltaproteobacteria bacterium]MBW2352326.1 hypothetical protein [Deltaproteobacteria bacterium]
MKLLHILKTEPDETTTTLKGVLSQGRETTEFPLYDGEPDYEKLIDLIFEHDEVISWW